MNIVSRLTVQITRPVSLSITAPGEIWVRLPVPLSSDPNALPALVPHPLGPCLWATSGENRIAGVLPVNQRAVDERLCDATPNITTRKVEFSLWQMIYICTLILQSGDVSVRADHISLVNVLTLQHNTLSAILFYPNI